MVTRSISFEDLVIKDVKSPLKQGERDVLEDDLDSWLIELNSFKRDIELQLTAQKGRVRNTKVSNLSKAEKKEVLASEEERRLKLIRLTVSIERRIQDVKKIRAERYSG